jgi:hypothetical protein
MRRCVIVDPLRLSILLPPRPTEDFDLYIKVQGRSRGLRRASPVDSRRQNTYKAIFRAVAVRTGIWMKRGRTVPDLSVLFTQRSRRRSQFDTLKNKCVSWKFLLDLNRLF